jgi:hypothetical protein
MSFIPLAKKHEVKEIAWQYDLNLHKEASCRLLPLALRMAGLRKYESMMS